MKNIADPWSEIENLIALWRLQGKRIVYVPNNGNAGDALIGAGAWQFFDAHQIDVKVCRTEDLLPGDFAIYAGGGNLIPSYSECADFLKKCLQCDVQGALVLPHTIRGNEDLLGKLDSRYTLFCRDYESLDWVKKNSNANARFAPDMAFNISLDALIESCKSIKNKFGLFRDLFFSPKQFVKYLLWKLRIKRVKPDKNGNLAVYRTDVESTKIVGSAAYDLSNLYGSRYRSRLECYFISYEFFDVLKKAKTIETNRLHVGVGSALLGKPVALHDNSYGKNSAIYRASIANKFPNVSLMED